MFSIKPKTLHYWYKEHLSGYREAIENGSWREKKIQVVDEDTGEIIKERPVPIAKPENFGTHMTLDEKQIGKKMYTIMTNSKTGKIGFLAQSMKPNELRSVVEKYLSTVSGNVQSVSCDMSPSYKKFAREVFPNTQLVVDKFHVIKHLMDALQQVRSQIKVNCLNATTAQADAGWTDIELLERSRYTLYKMETEWEDEEKETMSYLFKNYPVLEQAYKLTVQLRRWYDRKNIGSDIELRERELYNWCDEVNFSKISAFRAVRKMMEKHQDDILNYFKEGQTNAKAENMNAKIQRFFANNFGIKDRDFFMYRVAGYFS
jgi:transposase